MGCDRPVFGPRGVPCALCLGDGERPESCAQLLPLLCFLYLGACLCASGSNSGGLVKAAQPLALRPSCQDQRALSSVVTRRWDAAQATHPSIVTLVDGPCTGVTVPVGECVPTQGSTYGVERAGEEPAERNSGRGRGLWRPERAGAAELFPRALVLCSGC